MATSKCLHFEALDRADRREAAPPWHTDFGTKSSVLHLDRGVYVLLICKKPHACILMVQTWDFLLPWPNRVLVTNPDRQLPCHFSKTVLRIPSTRTHPAKIHIRYVQQGVPHRERSVFLCLGYDEPVPPAKASSRLRSNKSPSGAFKRQNGLR